MNHAPDLGCVIMLNGIVHPFDTQSYQGLLLILLPVDRTLDLSNFQLARICCHLSLPPITSDFGHIDVTQSGKIFRVLQTPQAL